MKKLLIILAIFIALSCSKEETIQKQIVGTWELHYYYQDNDSNPIDFNMAKTYQKHKYFKSEIQFLENRELIENSDCSSDFMANYTIDKNRIVLSDCRIGTYYDGCLYYTIFDAKNNHVYCSLSNNVLVIGFNGFYYKNSGYLPCVYYGYYERK